MLSEDDVNELETLIGQEFLVGRQLWRVVWAGEPNTYTNRCSLRFEKVR